jgi:hypothetical protein
VVVVGAAPRVDKKQRVIICEPVLLRVVATQHLAILELPFDEWVEVQAVRAARNEGGSARVVRKKRPLKRATDGS